MLSIIFFGRVAYLAYAHDFWSDIGQKHFAAVVGLPSIAMAALILVLTLETTVGNMEFKVLGFEFKGASGPLVLWVLCFLSMAFALWLLWGETYEPLKT